MTMHTRFLLALLALFSLDALAAPKTDVILLKNGDRVTGEVKSLFRGMLELSTDHMGTVQIEWEQIQEILSQTGQAVELANGERFYGALAKPQNASLVQIETSTGGVGVSSADVIAMYPVEAGFWDRLDLTFKLGFSWDSSSDVGKYNFGVDADWRDPRFLTRANFSTDMTTQQGRDDTNRMTVNLAHMHFTRSKRFLAGFVSAERNSELLLNLRALAGAGIGWVPLRDQRRLFGMTAGLDVNHEIPVDGAAETNLEAMGNLYFNYFLYSQPERQFKVDFSVFPSITDAGRYRASLATSFKFEILEDLFWDLSAYASYDSDPITPDAEQSDRGITSALGYNF